MSEFDENEFLDLPDDAVLAFAILENRMSAKVDKNLDSDGDPKYDQMMEYIETLNAFSEVHELGYLDGNYGNLENYQTLRNTFKLVRDTCRRISLKVKISSAKARKLGVIPIVILDSQQRQAIHLLIDALREKLNELDLAENKRDSLFAKLNAFSDEVDRNRRELYTCLTQSERWVRFSASAERPHDQALRQPVRSHGRLP